MAIPPSSTDTNRREIASAACALVADGGLPGDARKEIEDQFLELVVVGEEDEPEAEGDAG